MKSFAEYRELEEAKATYCGRCGTTHVPPSKGGTCPALAKEEVELDEAVKIGTKVKIHAPGKDYHGEVGHVGEIRHGAYKGAPKTYTVDYGDGKSIQLDKKEVKVHKEGVELDEGFKKGDFIKTPTGEIHRVFDVVGNSLETAPYRGKNGYGGGTTVHKTKATKVPTPKDVNEEVDQLEEMTQGKEYTQAQLQKKIQSGNWEATHDIKPGKHVEMRHHSGKRVTVQVKEEVDEALVEGKKPGHNLGVGWMLDKDKQLGQKVAQNKARAQQEKQTMQKYAGKKDVAEESELGDLAHQKTLKHRFLVTYSDPNHTSASMRKEKQQKHVLVPGTKDGVSVHEGEAKPLVKKYMNKQGYRVHDIEHVGMVSKKVNEEADQLDEKLSLVQGKPPRDFGRFTANNQTRVDTTSTGGRIHAGTVYTGKDKPSPSTAPTTSSKPAKKPSALDAIRAKRNPVSEEADQLDEADRPSMSVGGVRRREDDEGHGSQRYTGKTSTSHFVHINGRHWKTFDNADDANRASAAVQKKYPDKRVHVQTKTFYEEVASEGSTSLKSFAAFAGEAN